MLLILGGILAVVVLSELLYRQFQSKADAISHGSGVIVGIFWIFIAIGIMLGGGIGFVAGGIILVLYWLMWRPDVNEVGLDEWLRRKIVGNSGR